MNNFARAHNSYLEPPDDDPVCEGEHGCGEYLIRNAFSDGWFCNNEFCPEKFQGIEQRMAEALVEALESSRTYKGRYEQMKRSRDDAESKLLQLRLEFETYKENHLLD